MKLCRLSIAEQDEEDAGLARALRVSLENNTPHSDDSLEEAIRLSLTAHTDAPVSRPVTNAESSNSSGKYSDLRNLI